MLFDVATPSLWAYRGSARVWASVRAWARGSSIVARAARVRAVGGRGRNKCQLRVNTSRCALLLHSCVDAGARIVGDSSSYSGSRASLLPGRPHPHTLAIILRAGRRDELLASWILRASTNRARRGPHRGRSRIGDEQMPYEKLRGHSHPDLVRAGAGATFARPSGGVRGAGSGYSLIAWIFVVAGCGSYSRRETSYRSSRA